MGYTRIYCCLKCGHKDTHFSDGMKCPNCETWMTLICKIHNLSDWKWS